MNCWGSYTIEKARTVATKFWSISIRWHALYGGTITTPGPAALGVHVIVPALTAPELYTDAPYYNPQRPFVGVTQKLLAIVFPDPLRSILLKRLTWYKYKGDIFQKWQWRPFFYLLPIAFLSLSPFASHPIPSIYTIRGRWFSCSSSGTECCW